FPPAPPTQPTPPRAGGGRRTAILLTTTAVIAAIAGGTLAVQVVGGDGESNNDNTAGETTDPRSPGDEASLTDPDMSGQPADTGGGSPTSPPDPDAPYTLISEEVELNIIAPTYTAEAEPDGSRCRDGNQVDVDLDEPDVDETRSFPLPPNRGTEFQYTYCDHPEPAGQGIEFHPETFAGSIENADAGPEECHEAAREPTLPPVISIDDMQANRTLREGTGLCVETTDGTLVLVWIDRVRQDPFNANLPTYFTTLTQWAIN
ncbi:hypothetical protein RM780_25940, partial [Streptomyces sp. DSM 44917]|nr:hypothetical protein [Streptomyces sp. DSM 44917]